MKNNYKLIRGLKLKFSNKFSFFFFRTKCRSVSRLYRYIDNKGVLAFSLPHLFLGYVYDPFRSSYLSCYVYINGIISYRIGSEFQNIYDFFSCDLNNELHFGQVVKLNCLRGGYNVFNFPFFFNSNWKISRSSGMFSQLLRHDLKSGLSYLKVRKNFILILDSRTLVNCGRVNNRMHREFFLGKAGRSYLKGKKSIVRGIAMNPVDHPNGGRTPGGKVYRSFSNKIARSFVKTSTSFTRKNKFIV